MRRASLLALCASLLCVLTACTVCTEQIVDESISPDHRWTTRTTVRDCGRLSTPTTNVYLQPASSRARLGQIVVLVRHEHLLKVSWRSNTEVLVECAGCGNDVKIARPNAEDIAIEVIR